MKSHLPNGLTVVAVAIATMATPITAMAAAGVTQFAAGPVTLNRANMAPDALTKGKPVESGDEIQTGPSGQAQVRFGDGSLISVQQNSRVTIRNYAYGGEPKSDSFLLDLLQGGLRTITGLIGKRNRESYKVFTATATVGIRGSAFYVHYNPDGSLSVSTEQEAIEVCTGAGCTGLAVGESVQVVSDSVLPARTFVRASLPVPPPDQPAYVAGNQTNADGTSSEIPPPATVPPPNPPSDVTVSGLAAVFTTSDDRVGTPTGSNPETAGANASSIAANSSTLSSGQLVRQLDAENNLVTQKTGTSTGQQGAIGNPESGNYIGWGYWAQGSRTLGETTQALQNVHYVVARPTPENAMPKLGQVAYGLTGGTTPTATQGGVTTQGQLISGNLIADFSVSQINLNLLTRFGATDVPITANGNVTINGASFQGTSCCTSIKGLFAGSQADYAGLVYSKQSTPVGTVNGAAVFTRSPTP